jgi:hypothetical protein
MHRVDTGLNAGDNPGNPEIAFKRVSMNLSLGLVPSAPARVKTLPLIRPG